MIQVTHVLIRLKSDIPVTKIGGFLSDGSSMADIAGSGQKVRMRVIEYDVHVDGQDVPEMFCLVTDLDDWRAHPAAVLASAYPWRWDGSETALRELKSAIRGAGPSTGPIFRSRTPRLVHQEHAAWITATELTRAGQPVQPREISFTAAAPPSPRLAAEPPPPACPPPSPTPGVTAPSPNLDRRRLTIDRDRHRDHKTKTRQAFPAAGRGITSRKATATITVCGPLSV